MKKFIIGALCAICAICGFTTANAQAKFGHVNTQEIIQAMPEYNKAKTEIEALTSQYEADLKSMQDELQKKAKQDAIVEKEKQAAELKRKYFGPEGELFKKRTSLMTPIQDEIYNAVKDIADLRGYQLVLDRASDTGIIFGSPKIDISNEVLSKLGYAN